MTRKVFLTGATGFVGSHISADFEKNGWTVVRASFRLGEDISSSVMSGCEVLVHCAYDFRLRSAGEIQRVNVEGSKKILKAAPNAGIKKIIFVSSLSAYAGTSALYGRAKAEVEKVVADMGGVVLRPGLIIGEPAGGLFGRLKRIVKIFPVIPLLGPKDQKFFITHVDDLSRLIVHLADSGEVPAAVVFSAHKNPVSFSDLLKAMALKEGRKPFFVQMPGWPVGTLIHLAEFLGINFPVTWDNFQTLIDPDKIEHEKAGLDPAAYQSYFRTYDLT